MLKIFVVEAVSAVALCGAANADVSISNKPTQNMDCTAGVCTATAQKAVLNVGDLQTMLASGDVTVKTGTKATNIDIDQPLTWTTTSRLTLDARQSIIVKKPVAVAGTGALTIATNDGGKDGEFFFSNKGSVTFRDLASDLNVNGKHYLLVSDIASLAQAISNDASGAYALANDYDASSDGTYSAAPVETPLSGRFEGLGHSITNLTISTQDMDAALFLAVGPNGTLRDITLKGVSISGVLTNQSRPGRVGALAGENDGLIEWSFATGVINVPKGTNFPFIGGLVAWSLGTVLHARTDVRMMAGLGNMDVGGLVGSVQSVDGSAGRLDDVFATASVSADTDSSVGGLVGAVQDGTVSSASAFGNVRSGDGGIAGGLVGGMVSGSIEDSYATGNVNVGKGISGKGHCAAFAGGFAGGYNGSITNSYSTGSVQGRDGSCIGGFSGLFAYDSSVSSLLSASYSIGAVSAKGTAQVGGLIGHDYRRGAVEHAYWDVETSGTNDAAGNAREVHGAGGLTTSEFIAGLPQGFDSAIWGQSPSINSGYPYLLANPPQ